MGEHGNQLCQPGNSSLQLVLTWLPAMWNERHHFFWFLLILVSQQYDANMQCWWNTVFFCELVLLHAWQLATGIALAHDLITPIDANPSMLLTQGLYEDSIRYYVRAVTMNPKADNAWQYLRISLGYALLACDLPTMWTYYLPYDKGSELIYLRPYLNQQRFTSWHDCRMRRPQPRRSSERVSSLSPP
jgi:tetratricopeptide (TPR) repeat protein